MVMRGASLCRLNRLREFVSTGRIHDAAKWKAKNEFTTGEVSCRVHRGWNGFRSTVRLGGFLTVSRRAGLPSHVPCAHPCFE